MVPSATTFWADAAFSGTHVQTATNAVHASRRLLKSDFGSLRCINAQVSTSMTDLLPLRRCHNAQKNQGESPNLLVTRATVVPTMAISVAMANATYLS